MLTWRQTVPEILKSKSGDEFDNKGHPFRRPAEDKNMNERAGCFWTDEY
jgi:hypothetical protein